MNLQSMLMMIVFFFMTMLRIGLCSEEEEYANYFQDLGLPNERSIEAIQTYVVGIFIQTQNHVLISQSNE